jgi:hypothetical protein
MTAAEPLGERSPLSHRLTHCRVTPHRSPSPCCVSPSFRRSRLIAADFIAFFSVRDMLTELRRISSEEHAHVFPTFSTILE